MTNVYVIDIQPQHTVAVKYKTPANKIPENMGKAFRKVMAYLHAKHVMPSAMPFALYPSMTPDKNGNWEVVSGMPIKKEIAPDGDVEPYDLPGGKVAVATHIGSYETLEKTYKDMGEWIRQHDMTPGPMMWEYYFTDPKLEPDQSKWRTDIYWPVTT